ncbi:hypothetical protein MHYP_G00229620 [Metynnis hypsauchen]
METGARSILKDVNERFEEVLRNKVRHPVSLNPPFLEVQLEGGRPARLASSRPDSGSDEPSDVTHWRRSRRVNVQQELSAPSPAVWCCFQPPVRLPLRLLLLKLQPPALRGRGGEAPAGRSGATYCPSFSLIANTQLEPKFLDTPSNE